MNRITDISLYENMVIDGDLDVSGAITGGTIPIENISNVDKQSFKNLIDNGDFKLWGSGASSAPDGWTLGSSSCAIENTITKIGASSVKVSISAPGTSGRIVQTLDANDYTHLKGRVVTAGVFVYSAGVGVSRILLNDGVSSFASVSNTLINQWELLTVTGTVNANATAFTINLYPDYSGVTDNYAYFDGVILVEGSICPAFSPKPLSFMGWESFPPFLDENSANTANKPTLVTRGLFGGYSLPEYAAGEELLFRMRVPHSWNGVANPWFVAITSISTGEDIGDKYKFQLEWQAEDVEAIIPDTTAETLTDEVTVADGTAYYAEIIAFELDATTLMPGQNLQGRLRRIAASASSVTNEIIVWHWDTRWLLNKLGTESIQGY